MPLHGKPAPEARLEDGERLSDVIESLEKQGLDDMAAPLRTIAANQGTPGFYDAPAPGAPPTPAREDTVSLEADHYLDDMAASSAALHRTLGEAAKGAKRRGARPRPPGPADAYPSTTLAGAVVGRKRQPWQPGRGVFASPPMTDDESEVLFAREPVATLRFVRRRRRVFALRRTGRVGSPSGLWVYPVELSRYALDGAAMGRLGLFNHARARAHRAAAAAMGAPARLIGMVAMPCHRPDWDGGAWRERIAADGDNIRLEFFFEPLPREFTAAERRARIDGTVMQYGAATDQAARAMSALSEATARNAQALSALGWDHGSLGATTIGPARSGDPPSLRAAAGVALLCTSAVLLLLDVAGLTALGSTVILPTLAGWTLFMLRPRGE